MKKETLSNLIQFCIFALLGLSALVGAIFYSAWWHFVTAVMCFILAYVIYTDNNYGIESVQAYVHRKLSR